MNIKFSMPEILVIFSLIMYSQSYTFSVLAFSLGLFGRTIVYLLDYSTDMKKAEVAKEDLTDTVNAFKSIFSGTDKKEI